MRVARSAGWYGQKEAALDGRLMGVDAGQQGAVFTAGVPRVVVDGGFYVSRADRVYDISPDGKRFLLIESPNTGTQADSAGLTVVLNWAEELKRLSLPAEGRR